MKINLERFISGRKIYLAVKSMPCYIEEIMANWDRAVLQPQDDRLLVYIGDKVHECDASELARVLSREAVLEKLLESKTFLSKREVAKLVHVTPQLIPKYAPWSKQYVMRPVFKKRTRRVILTKNPEETKRIIKIAHKYGVNSIYLRDMYEEAKRKSIDDIREDWENRLAITMVDRYFEALDELLRSQ